MAVQGQPGVKSSRDPISNNRWAQWYASVIPATVGSLKEEDHSPGWLVQKVKLYLKNNQRKKY
jgi:hypothetical protein